MAGDLFSWDDLRLVLAVADGRSLAGAADRLALNSSTVFRRLGQIERRLGTKLFERHRAGYVPTPAGEDAAGLARRMEDEVAGLSRRLSGRAPAPSGEVRITTNDALLSNLLAPILARFRARYPDITLDVVIGNAALNLSRRDADVAIRATEKPPETLVGRRLATIGWALYGRADAFDPVGEEGPDLSTASWVAPGEDLAGVSRLLLRYTQPERIVCRVNTVAGLIDAVEAGIGISPLPCIAGDRRPILRRLSAPEPSLATSLWLLTHPDLRAAPRIRALLDFVADAIVAQRAALAGEVEPAGGGTEL